MLQLHCTRKLLDDLGLSKSSLAHIQPGDTLLGNWYANLIRIGREKCVLLMNETTLYSFILPWSFKNKPDAFAVAFRSGLTQALESEWIEPDDIARVLGEYDKAEFTVTGSRSMLGSMNDLAQHYEYYVSEAGGVRSRKLAQAVRRVNQTPQRTLEWRMSDEALEQVFKDKNKQGDVPSRREPDDHVVIAKILRKIGSDHTLHELYGLFYGCAAATNPVPPSGHLPLIFDPKDTDFASEQEAKTLIVKMMTLWNLIATWDPEGRDFFFPPTKYPASVNGVLTRSEDLVSFVHYFIKGLDIGRTDERDFSVDASAALRDLAELTQNMEQYIELLERSDKVTPKTLREGLEIVERFEQIAADCIGRVHIGLTAARRNTASRPAVLTSVKTGRNDPCPCGSGMKYKRCCGLVH